MLATDPAQRIEREQADLQKLIQIFISKRPKEVSSFILEMSPN